MESVSPIRRAEPCPRSEHSQIVLCVDDELKGLYVREMLLRSQGYEVLTASGGSEALVLFAASPVDAVVLDFAMPEMNGGEVAAEMKRLRPDVKILMLSAYVDLPEDALKFVDARAVKGSSPGAFLGALRQLLSC